MRTTSKIVGVLAGYAGYRFITTAFKLIGERDIAMKLGTAAASIGMASSLGFASAFGVDALLDSVESIQRKKEVESVRSCFCGKHSYDSMDPQEQGFEAASEMKENRNE